MNEVDVTGATIGCTVGQFEKFPSSRTASAFDAGVQREWPWWMGGLQSFILSTQPTSHKMRYLATFLLLAVLGGRARSFSVAPTRPSSPRLVAVTTTTTTPSTATVVLRSAIETLPTADPTNTSEAIDFYESQLHLLDQALDKNASAAEALLQTISTLRQQEQQKTLNSTAMDATAINSVDAFVTALLEEGPDRSLPLWSKLPWLRRTSRRARLASLRRTLGWTTPPVATEDQQQSMTVEEEAQDALRRRRRALVSLLRQLSSSNATAAPAIVGLERQARREAKGNGKEDLIARRPAELETPKYDVLATTQRRRFTVEVRQYQPYAVCSVNLQQPRAANPSTDAPVQEPNMGGARAFGALAGYLFGKNQQETAMKMTTPVLIQPEAIQDQRTMSFVLPSTYWQDVEAAPAPLPDSGVQVQAVPGETRAALLFGGYAGSNTVAQRRDDLLKAVRDSLGSEWELVGDGEDITVAQYNDPFTPPWKRLNEVSVPVVRSSQ